MRQPENAASPDREEEYLADLFGTGNTYRAVKPFYTVPSWWRGFFFALLTPRDIALYMYLLAHANKYGAARPTYDVIQRDLNLNNARVVSKSLQRLEALGFILRRKARNLKGSQQPRNIYRRPSIAYTIWTLLREDKIDADLRPIVVRKAKGRSAERESNSGAVVYGLRVLLGISRMQKYSTLNKTKRRQYLLDGLAAHIREEQRAYEASRNLIASSFDDPDERADGFGRASPDTMTDDLLFAGDDMATVEGADF